MEQNLTQKTKFGMLWNAFEKFASQGISFVLNIILARLLTPHDYGVIGMLTIFLTFSNVFIDSGFSRALVQKQDRNEKDFSTVLLFNVSVSLILYVVLFLCSPTIARFYKTPELVQLERVFFIVIILNSLSVVQNSQLQAAVDFKRIAFINTLTQICSGVAGIIAAFYGLGAWALVIQALSKSFISAVLFWVVGKWIPKTGFSYQSFKALFGFGSKLLATGLLSTTVTNINSLVVGKIYTPTNLGYYTRAQQFPELLSGTLGSVLNNATFPLMASLQNDRENLVYVFKKLVKTAAMVVFPAMVGLSVLSKPIIIVLLGEQWLPATELLFWLSLSYIFTPLSIINMNILNAIGRSDLFMKVDFSKIPFIAVTMLITFPISLKAVVVGNFVSAFIYFYINAFMPGRLFKYGAFKQLTDMWKYIVASIIMGFVVIYAITFVKSSVLQLVFGILIGVVVYVGCLLILRDSEVKRFLEKIKVIKGYK